MSISTVRRPGCTELMATHKGLSIRAFRDRTAFEEWLDRNQASCVEGLWLKFAKKGSSKKTLSYEVAREEAIRVGWIDGLINRIDDDYYAIRFTPRRPHSRWSKINRDIAEDLIRRGRMKPGGRREVEIARETGSWDRAYAGSATIEVPDDFERALRNSPKAQQAFAAISRARRYSILMSIYDAKRPETRSRRIVKYIAALEAGGA